MPAIDLVRPSPPGPQKAIPILSSSAASSTPPDDPMDVTPVVAPSMGPPLLNSPGGYRNGGVQVSNGESEPTINGMNGTSGPAIGAAAAAQQPKVVQTAFIHKLYKCVL